MNEQQQAVLAIAARLTGYPSDSFREELAELRAFADETMEAGPVREAVLTMLGELGAMTLREVRERYVAAFDLKDRTGLYLTAHELGDSRKRGVALLELRAFIRSCGFEPAADELPDYLPLLYELVSVAPASEEVLPLLNRLAFATQRIRMHLSDGNPFKPVFEALMHAVFEAPTEEAMKQREQYREKPDTDPMPYPLMYQ